MIYIWRLPSLELFKPIMVKVIDLVNVFLILPS